MTVEDFLKLSKDTRDAQKEYYKCPKEQITNKEKALRKAKELESQFDNALNNISKAIADRFQEKLF